MAGVHAHHGVCKWSGRTGGGTVSGSHARLFAMELQRTRFRCAGEEDGKPDRVLSPTGLCFGRLFFVGALLEVEGRPGDLMQVRVADPTGAFSLRAGRREAGATAALEGLCPPAFVAVSGTPLLQGRGPGSGCLVVPEAIRMVPRPARDAWVVRTAGETVARLESLAGAIGGEPGSDPVMAALREYRLDRRDLLEMGLAVRAALESVRTPAPSGSPAPDPAETVRQVMAGRGPKAQVPLEEIIDACAATGLDRETVLAALAGLLEEGDCYMPRKGVYRLV